MLIGIDARLYTQTGVGRYIRNVIRELIKLDTQNHFIVYLRKEEFGQFQVPNSRWMKKIADIPWHTVKEQISAPYLFLKDNLDVAHFPYFNVPVLYPGKYLLTVHDLIVDHFDTGKASTLPPVFYRVKRAGYHFSLSLGIKRASGITAISETTKQEIMEHYHVSPHKITVTYDALDELFKKAVYHSAKIRYFHDPYILYVGNAYPHKNLERLIRAYQLLLRKKKNIRLVLAGDDSFFYPRLKNLVKELSLIDKVIFFGNADDTKLVNLYSNAKCLVFPSLMEGFGLPNFEALACGCLPVISDIPVFHEIWSEDLDYFDPVKITDISDKLKNVLEYSNVDYRKKVKKASDNIDNFSWKKTASDTLEIYKKIYRS